MAHPETTLETERELLAQFGGPIVGMDEVGRGAIAGPVMVGAVLISADSALLAGVRDSKLLSAARREDLHAQLLSFVTGAVGAAEASEVDEHGIIGALRLAGMRALAQLPPVQAVLLDGSHDWLSTPAQLDLLAPVIEGPEIPVRTQVKADMTCWSVAAASILAKVRRDAAMVELAGQFPGYGFEKHKGYGTAAHLQAVKQAGLISAHRRSWAI